MITKGGKSVKTFRPIPDVCPLLPLRSSPLNAQFIMAAHRVGEWLGHPLVLDGFLA
jgi:hypothetical protein